MSTTSPAPAATYDRPASPFGLFRARGVGSWIAIGTALLYLLLCWTAFFSIVQPFFEGTGGLRLEADSSTYFAVAGINVPGGSEYMGTSLLSFATNLFGPVLVAKVLRTPLLVTVLNCFLLLLMVRLAGGIPGVRRRFFLLLFMLNAQSLVSIATLNKEIFASLGLVAFFAWSANRRRYWVLALAAVFSIMARWEQLAVILLYLFLESRFSPFRKRHKTALVFVVGFLTILYPLALRYSGIDINGVLAIVESSGFISRLDNIQANFGFPLVIVPKILMNLFNRLLLPTYFVSSDFLSVDFSDLQSNVIIHLQTLAMLGVFLAALFKRRLDLSRSIPYFIALYLILTAVSPFVQSRYAYPVYVLLCIELARDPLVLRSLSSQDAGRTAKRLFSMLSRPGSEHSQTTDADGSLPA